jgi:hypothetical protein
VREVAEDGKTPIAVCLNQENIAGAKLRIDTRRWIMSKLRPEKYGDSR